MAGINGKSGRYIKKLDVQESNVPALGFSKIRFKHKASLGDETISLTSLTAPTEATALGFVQPNGSILNSINLRQFRDNFVLQSSLRGVMDDYVDYVINSNSSIRLLIAAEEGEIFTGTLDHNPRIGTTLVDATPIVVTGVLEAGETDFNVGTYEVGKFLDQQVGAVIVMVDGIVQARNTANSSTVLDGNYYEVSAGAGMGTLIRFNAADPSNDRNIIVISVGALVERPTESQMALIEALQGQVDAIVPTLAALAGVPETDFQATPNSIDLKAFGDRVLALEEIPDSELVVQEGNGHGSTNTKIRRFSTIVRNAGSAITYADSATNGASFTINEDGLYAMSWTDLRSAGNDHIGFTLNSSELTTDVSSLVNEEDRLISTTVISGSYCNVSTMIKLSAGDVIRPHSAGLLDGTTSLVRFRIMKVR